jgi:RNA polymerase sigma factor (sigma-70 family)
VADRARFEAFYREELTRVTRACALVTLDRSRAEEIAAEAFARLWSHWGRIEDEDHAGGYVFKTAMRLCAKQRIADRRLASSQPPERPSVDEMQRALVRDEVFTSLATLPVRQRQCLVLRDWAGFSTEEVAAMLGMNASTVRVHISRGRQALRRALTVEERDG